MDSQPDFYALLGLNRQATPDEIRKAFFSAAHRLHPDKNITPGETEIFLEVQQAYETLSDPEKRAHYDSQFPPQEETPYPIRQRVLYSRQSLVRLEEPQLVYALLELTPRATEEQIPSPPLNLCLALDCSTSMQGLSMDLVKATAIQLLRRLRPQDVFSVVTFSDRAEALIPATRSPDLPKLEARIQMLQTSGGTEIFQGLEKAFSETRRYLSTSNVNHIILITDGRTYGDEENCLALAQEAVGAGVGISGLGIGDEWNDILLDELARRTGGSSLFVSNPKDIQNVLLEKFSHLWQVFAEDVTLEFRKMETASLRYAFRLKPEVGLLALESPLRLGPVLRDGRLSVLLEFLVGPAAVSADIVPLLDGELQAVLPSQSFPLKPAALRMARPVAVEPAFDPPPQEIIQALSRLTLYRLQEQARLDLSLGSYNLAAERLQRLATHLLQRGKTGLARTVLLEAENVQFNKRFSSQGDKSIKYGTRALASAGEE